MQEIAQATPPQDKLCRSSQPKGSSYLMRMADSRPNGKSLLLDTTRLELEKTCVFLIAAYVRMLEKPKTDYLAKGPVMSTRKSANGNPNSYLESSVDPPLADKISGIIQEVHDTVPPREDVHVPSELSQRMREHPSQLRKEDFGDLFRVEEAVRSVEGKELSSAELVMMYLRSFRNILEYDLSHVEELQTRIIGQLGTILADVLELCYPNAAGIQLNEQLHADLMKYKSKVQEHPRSN